MSKTIESELKRYRLCRAEMERGCYVECAVCANQMSRTIFTHFVDLDDLVEGGK